MRGNSITQLPSDVSRLVNLEVLDVSRNPLRTLLCGVTRMHCLRELDASRCQVQVGFDVLQQRVC